MLLKQNMYSSMVVNLQCSGCGSSIVHYGQTYSMWTITPMCVATKLKGYNCLECLSIL